MEDQLNSKNLQMKPCMCIPIFHPQYFLKLSVYIFQYIFWVAINAKRWSFRCPILFGISLLLKRNKMTHSSISSSHLCLFFQRTDSVKSCIKHPQSYLKNHEIEIKSNLETLFHTVFIGKLQKIHLFKSSCPEMFYK